MRRPRLEVDDWDVGGDPAHPAIVYRLSCPEGYVLEHCFTRLQLSRLPAGTEARIVPTMERRLRDKGCSCTFPRQEETVS